MEKAPYRAEIKLDIWVWDRKDAQHILEQLVEKIEGISTTRLSGGTLPHHHRIRMTLLEKGEE
jgi:hypothetical protein